MSGLKKMIYDVFVIFLQFLKTFLKNCIDAYDVNVHIK